LPVADSSQTNSDDKTTETDFSSEHFDAPIRLMVKDTPLNEAASQMYPSPAMFDIDGDEKLELVVGDIFGSLNVYENTNEGDGDPVWATHKGLKSCKGDAIEVHS